MTLTIHSDNPQPAADLPADLPDKWADLTLEQQHEVRVARQLANAEWTGREMLRRLGWLQ